MTTPVSLSTGLLNHILALGSIKNALQGGALKAFSGSVPANADAAETGSLLMKMSDNGASWVPELASSGSVTLTGGAAGQISQVTVNGVNLLSKPVVYNTSLFQTALDLAAEINANLQSPKYWAVASNLTVNIYALAGTGAGPNTYVVTPTMVTMTASSANFAGGVNSAAGIKFAHAAAGVLSKISSQVIQGNVLASATASYWRIYADQTDSGGADLTGRLRRAQGIVGTSAETLVIPNTALVFGTVQRLGSFLITA